MMRLETFIHTVWGIHMNAEKMLRICNKDDFIIDEEELSLAIYEEAVLLNKDKRVDVLDGAHSMPTDLIND